MERGAERPPGSRTPPTPRRAPSSRIRAVVSGSEIVVRVAPPSAEEVDALASGPPPSGSCSPSLDPDGIARLRERDVVAFAMESILRITRAQSMDALVAGHRGRLQGGAARGGPGAEALPDADDGRRHHRPGTRARDRRRRRGPAGDRHRPPARCRRVRVRRPPGREGAGREPGASFLELGVRTEETEGGYATELTPDQQAQQQAALEERTPGVRRRDHYDAAIPGRPAPTLIPASAVEKMRPGSVIVDLAAESGGNCELIEAGAAVERGGVTVDGTTNLPSLMAYHTRASSTRGTSPRCSSTWPPRASSCSTGRTRSRRARA